MTILLAAAFDDDEWRAWWPLLTAALPGERLVRDRTDTDAADITVAFVANPPTGALQGLPGLALIQSLWAGVDKLLADPSVPVQVPLARMVDPSMNATMAETALWAVLALQRGFFDYAAQQRAGIWKQHPLRRAEDLNVAVLGLGQMGGRALEALARQGYRVTGWSTRAGDAALPQVLAGADIVVNLLPLTPATTALFDSERFAQMRRGAAFVNLARGAQVVDADLLAALDSGRLRHAVLDVFHTEPLPASHRFWTHPQVTLLPHVAAQTDPRTAAQIAANHVRGLREGRALQHLADRRRGY